MRKSSYNTVNSTHAECLGKRQVTQEWRLFRRVMFCSVKAVRRAMASWNANAYYPASMLWSLLSSACIDPGTDLESLRPERRDRSVQKVPVGHAKLTRPSSRVSQSSLSRLSVERRIGQPGGNSRRRWHGTDRACFLGDNESQINFCDYNECSLCSILRVCWFQSVLLCSRV